MIEVREACDAHEREALLALRHEVFVEEQGVPTDLEIDEHDETALHIVAFDDGELVGTCRVLRAGSQAKFGRLVVARRARGRGIGAALLARLVEIARGHDCTHISWTAAVAYPRVIAFYEREGAFIVSRDDKQVTFRLTL